MIFRQLFEPLSSTYTYLLGCEVCPCDLPENLEKYCQQMTESPQGWPLTHQHTSIAGTPALLTKEIDHEQRKDNE